MCYAHARCKLIERAQETSCAPCNCTPKPQRNFYLAEKKIQNRHLNRAAGFLLHMRIRWDAMMLPNAVARTESPNWGRATCTSHPTPTERISTECWGALRGCSKPASAVSAGFLLHTRIKWDAMMLLNAVARTEQPKPAEQHSK